VQGKGASLNRLENPCKHAPLLVAMLALCALKKQIADATEVTPTIAGNVISRKNSTF
jgi:hypothetical protein